MRFLQLFIVLSLITSFSLPMASNDSDTESADVTDWKVLQDVKMIEKDNLYMPDFGADIKALDGKVISLKGYMMPLEQAKQQKNFILSANPIASCFFCETGGAESMVEIQAKKAVTFSYNPIVITGKLELLEDDPMGMFYRLVNAEAK